MKSDLKRIEATLQYLGSSTAHPKLAATRTQAQPKNRSYSFEISGVQKHNSVQILGKASEPSSKEPLSCLTDDLQSLPAQQSALKEPVLPKFTAGDRADSGSNPASKMNLSPQINITACKAELQQILHQITNLYIEGPIVDGWLESYQCPAPTDMTQRGESVTQMDYVQQGYIESGKVSCESPHAGYRLCGLNPDGQKWFRICPLEQLPSVTMAIARYQNLQQLLERKHYYETCLRQGSIE